MLATKLLLQRRGKRAPLPAATAAPQQIQLADSADDVRQSSLKKQRRGYEGETCKQPSGLWVHRVAAL